MLAKDLISDVVPAIRTSDSGLKALYWMDIFRISHLPIVNNKEFLGLISDKDIYDLNMADEPIGNHSLSLFSPFVYKDQHIFEVIGLITKMKLTVVPVLDDKKNYQGLITIADLMDCIGQFSSFNQPGGIIVLELNENDYMFSQIAQIIESNDAKILSSYLFSIPNTVKIQLTIKLNATDIAGIIQTFERFEYDVTGSYMESDDEDDMYDSRFESFMKYLSI